MADTSASVQPASSGITTANLRRPWKHALCSRSGSNSPSFISRCHAVWNSFYVHAAPRSLVRMNSLARGTSFRTRFSALCSGIQSFFSVLSCSTWMPFAHVAPAHRAERSSALASQPYGSKQEHVALMREDTI
jgi:hypothetical protein